MLRLHAGRLPVLNTEHCINTCVFLVYFQFSSQFGQRRLQRVLDRSIWREGSLQTIMLCEARAYVPADDDK